MKALAADGHILCCGLVRTLQLLREDVCVTGADSIDEMLTLIPGLPDLDLVLLDASMPGMENFAGLRRLVEKLPDVPVVVTSPSESRTQIVAAIRSGARGYFSPSTKACVLRHALPLILSGEIYIPACALRLDHGNGMFRSKGLAPRMGDAGGKLTPRQCEILVMLGEGKSNKEIAREAKVLEGTIKLHVRGYCASSASGTGPKQSSRPRAPATCRPGPWHEIEVVLPPRESLARSEGSQKSITANPTWHVEKWSCHPHGNVRLKI